jgi:ADP-heptose:LPS heptosyltransferase
MARAVGLPGVQLVSLQHGTASEQLGALEPSTGLNVAAIPGLDLYGNLNDLAALIACCDVVVTASTATAHLSAAIGTPTWLLVHRIPHWPWGLKGARTPWYESARLFRQRRRGDWRLPLKDARKAMQHLLYQLQQRRDHCQIICAEPRQSSKSTREWG